MNRRMWMVLGLLGLGTALFFWLASQMLFGYRSFGAGQPLIDMALEHRMNEYQAKEFESAASVGMDLPGTTALMAEPEIGRILPAPLPPRYGGEALDEVDRDFEYFSSYEVVARNVSEYMAGLKEYVMSVEGLVLHSSMSSREKTSTGSLTIKVPVASFDATNNQITTTADEVVGENVSSADVTGVRVSLEDRQQNLEEEKLTLEEELAAATTTAERRRIELQIERVDRQLENLADQLENQQERVEYATVNVFVVSDEDYFDPRVYREPDFEDQIQAAWRAVGFVLQRLVILAIWVGVFAVLWLPVVLLVMWWKKRGKKVKEKK